MHCAAREHAVCGLEAKSDARAIVRARRGLGTVRREGLLLHGAACVKPRPWQMACVRGVRDGEREREREAAAQEVRRASGNRTWVGHTARLVERIPNEQSEGTERREVIVRWRGG